MEIITYKDAIAKSMKSAMVKNPNTIVYGLGVTDHIGVFGTTLGLKEKFGKDRVFDTPISEDAMTGFALGASLNGLYPIHIHIRVDFMLLAMNQLGNSISKYSYMYGGHYKTPMLIRGIIGRSWGQGAQHSQSLQALFAHIPGLTVVMPSRPETVLSTYDYAVNHYDSPVISLEHRLLYNYSFHKNSSLAVKKKNPFTSYLARKGKDVTIVATSSMVVDALNAADFVKKNHGIDVEVIDMHCLTHPDVDMILSSVKKTGKLIAADTGWAGFGVCSEISRLVAINNPGYLKMPVVELSMAPAPCPTSQTLENFFYPDMGSTVDAVYKLIYGKKHNKILPSQEYKRKLYKEFKGPF